MGKLMFGKDKNYIISSNLGFEEIIQDINKCDKVYYLITVSKDIGLFNEIADTSHAMAIVIDPKLKLLEIYDSNGLTPDTKHVYFWSTKLAEYLINNGIEVHRKINADEPYCPQSVTAFAKEFKGEQQCLVWSYWYIWLRINNPDIPAEAIRKYMAEMLPNESFDRVRRIASIAFESIDITYSVYSLTGPRKILMLRKPFAHEVTYTPYGVTYLNLDKNKLPSYYESIYITDVKNKTISIPYIKGRSTEEIEKLIDDEIKKL
jgi:hypothetical protein